MCVCLVTKHIQILIITLQKLYHQRNMRAFNSVWHVQDWCPLEWPRAETGKARNGRGRKLVYVVLTRSEFPGFARSTVKLGIPPSMRYPLSVLKNSTLKLTHSYLPADVTIMRSTVSPQQILAFRVSSTKEEK